MHFGLKVGKTVKLKDIDLHLKINVNFHHFALVVLSEYVNIEFSLDRRKYIIDEKAQVVRVYLNYQLLRYE